MTSKIKDISKGYEGNQAGFDFDYWANMAKNDSEAFEEARKKEIEKFISGLNDDFSKDKMRRLQWRVDAERKLCKNPMESAIRIYDMMWESVGKNFEAMQVLADYFNEKGELVGNADVKKSNAKIVTFKKKGEITDTLP